MSNLKAILFDFDGLLFDTESTWDKTYYIFLRNHNIEPDLSIEDQMFGGGLIQAIQLMKDKLGLRGDTATLVNGYRELFYSEFSKIKEPVLPGSAGLLEFCLENDLKIALTSGGHSEEMLKNMLREQKLIDYFSIIVSSDDVEKGKPDPAVYMATLKKLDLPSDQCLALEDSPNGVLAAQAASIKVFGVNREEKIRKKLMAAGADKVFSSLEEVTLT